MPFSEAGMPDEMSQEDYAEGKYKEVLATARDLCDQAREEKVVIDAQGLSEYFLAVSSKILKKYQSNFHVSILQEIASCISEELLDGDTIPNNWKEPISRAIEKAVVV